MFVDDEHACFHPLPSSHTRNAKGKTNSRKEQTTRSPQQVVAMCRIKKKNHGGGDKNHNLKGDFLVAYFETRHLLLMAEEEGEWEFRDGGLGFTGLLFNSAHRQALSRSIQCLRMKTQGRGMGEALIYQVLVQNNFKLVFCYFPSIYLSVIGSFKLFVLLNVLEVCVVTYSETHPP